ncbi:PspA-associated protein PspAA [Amycolatopsis benzoatilytica]|uniref:PspA-associated protein PspAA n=1 Tax=Amycolatopsis benzoatilytica TaxID=346045 RepID=UPI00037E68BC|nr:hypothetical protein [Amycolatopsis benzoatilytica]
MIIRILGQGQYDVAAAGVDRLNELDARLQDAAESGDAAGFAAALRTLVAEVRNVGEQLPEDALVVSDLLLPAEDSDLEQVRALLSDEGLIPG